jgi:hypothetical protein
MAITKLTLLQRKDATTGTMLGQLFKIDGPKPKDAKIGDMTEGYWCNFGLKSQTFDSKDKGWVFTSDADVIADLVTMKQIESAYEKGTIDQSRAQSMFEKAHSSWLKKMTEKRSDFKSQPISYLQTASASVTLTDNGKLAGQIRRFFRDVKEFTISSRFLNTLNIIFHDDGHEGVVEYVKSYFNLIDMASEGQMITQKMESDEWSETIENGLMVTPVTKKINSRLKIYYGEAGTFKTTTAVAETAECVVCNSSMLPADMFKSFDFVDGLPTFKPSPMILAMQGDEEHPNGRKITLDEFNLLPFETIRFLQGVLDGKKSFMTPEGLEVTIGDDFGIIATMNLVVNNDVYALPQPFVDRASELREFTLTDEQLGESF